MQAVITLMKLVVYNGVSVLVASVCFGVANSPVFWDVVASLPGAVGLNIGVAMCLMGCLAFIGLMIFWEDLFEVTSQCPHLARCAA